MNRHRHNARAIALKSEIPAVAPTESVRQRQLNSATRALPLIEPDGVLTLHCNLMMPTGVTFSWRATVLLGLLLATLIARASEGRHGIHEAIVDGDYFGAGEAASPVRPVEGDAFIVSPNVNLTQPVEGDALIAGGGVSISAPVGGDLYGMGGSVLLESAVAHNARLTGGRVEIGTLGQVAGKTTLVGGRVAVLGKAGHQLTVFAEHVTLDGDVDGNVTIAARTL